MRLGDKAHALLIVGFALAATPGMAQRKLPPPDLRQIDDPLPPTGPGPRGTSQAVPGELRYDAVGYAGISALNRDSKAIGGNHRSLPIGSFAEVTALDTGRTILIMITGGIASGGLIDLTPAAARLLRVDGAGPIAVRVRRVDPPGGDQQALREGRPAADRIDSPPVLLSALRKRLPGGPAPARRPAMTPELSRPGPAIVQITRPEVGTAPRRGAYFVQVAALSSAARASALARELGGSVQSGGGIHRVRTGPYADQASAQRGRDAAARHGYGDARIVKIN